MASSPAGASNGAAAQPPTSASDQTQAKQPEAPKPIQFPGAFESHEYSILSKLSVALNKGVTHDEGSFNICFWIYLVKNTGAGVVIRQVGVKLLPSKKFIQELFIPCKELRVIYAVTISPLNSCRFLVLAVSFISYFLRSFP
jgi:hypothetical protein